MILHINTNKLSWTLLRCQKLWLIEQKGDDAQGLLSFLDWIQDEAVDQGVPEETVFGELGGDDGEASEAQSG